MARAFGRLVFLLPLLVLIPAVATSAPIEALGAGWLNSSITFGGASFQDDGYDISPLVLYGDEIVPCACPEDVLFSAGGGSLVSVTNPLGQTVWRYEGGTFSVRFQNSIDPFFTAPIDSLVITAFGSLEPSVTNILATYQLGAGLFDAAFASLYGIPKKTGPGQMFESLVLLDGDETSEELVADDGGGVLSVEAPPVPEPSLTVLVGLGLAAAVRARRRT